MVEPQDHFDVVIVGAGFGGLACALALADKGARVAVCEVLDYPGGCAATFHRKGFAFEAGATLFSGLGEQQLFGRWQRRFGLEYQIDWIDPLVELRAPGLHLTVPARRDGLLEQLCAMPQAPQAALRSFFALQRRVADALWAAFDDPSLLPPLTGGALWRHVKNGPDYLSLLPLVGRPLGAVLARFGLEAFEPLRTYLDALCQITLQCTSSEAEAPFALAVMDYYYRGTGHIRGGIGSLAWSMVRAITSLGGEVYFSRKVRSLHPEGGGWRVSTRRGELFAQQVVANVLPQSMRGLLGVAPGEMGRLDQLSRRVEEGWGAAMLYLVARPPAGAGEQPHHLELVADPRRPFHSGNHLFVSVSGAADEGRAPAGLRTLTVSTHVPLAQLKARPEPERAVEISAIQSRMDFTLAQLAPEWAENIEHRMTASPRTFERFTLREGGWVGGLPRRSGLRNYTGMMPFQVQPGLYLVGDSTFLGQSTFATALSGVRVAEQVSGGERWRRLKPPG